LSTYTSDAVMPESLGIPAKGPGNSAKV